MNVVLVTAALLGAGCTSGEGDDYAVGTPTLFGGGAAGATAGSGTTGADAGTGSGSGSAVHDGGVFDGPINLDSGTGSGSNLHGDGGI